AKRNAREEKFQGSEWRQIEQHNRLAAPQKLGRLLVRRRALKKAIVEIRGQERLPFFNPLIVVRSCERGSRLPMTSDRPETRGEGAVVPRTERLVRVLDVRQEDTRQICLVSHKSSPNWISPLPVALRMLGFLIDATERPLVYQRHLQEGLW